MFITFHIICYFQYFYYIYIFIYIYLYNIVCKQNHANKALWTELKLNYLYLVWAWNEMKRCSLVLRSFWQSINNSIIKLFFSFDMLYVEFSTDKTTINNFKTDFNYHKCHSNLAQFKCVY